MEWTTRLDLDPELSRRCKVEELHSVFFAPPAGLVKAEPSLWVSPNAK
jgi:hypothetical protein